MSIYIEQFTANYNAYRTFWGTKPYQLLGSVKATHLNKKYPFHITTLNDMIYSTGPRARHHLWAQP